VKKLGMVRPPKENIVVVKRTEKKTASESRGYELPGTAE